MLKYSFLVYHAEYKSFLQELKRLGVLHIEAKKHEPTTEIQDLYRSVTDLLRTIKSLNERVQGKEVNGEKPSYINGEDVLKRIREIELSLEAKHQHAGNLDKEIQQLLPWGDFNPSSIKNLEKEGLWIRFLVCRDKHYNESWEQDNYIQIISDQGSFRYFVLIEKSDDRSSEMIDLPGVDELYLPNNSLTAIYEAKGKLQHAVDTLNAELDLIAKYCVSQLSSYCDSIKSELDESNAIHQTTQEVDNSVMVIEGYVPKPEAAELDKYLDANNILSIVRKPNEDEKVPVKLKNNKFARLFEPIGDLYELPNHKELDLVPFFAPFYMMFFGFSLGDAGYGLLILAVATWLKTKKPEMKDLLSLAQWLAVSTVIFGVLTGTFFGIDLINSKIEWLEGVKQFMIDKDSMFTLALILGVIQILFGMVIKIVNISIAKGFAYSYSTIGWLLLIIGSGITYFLNQAEAVSPVVGKYLQNGILIVSGTLILLLNNPRRNVIMNFLAGLWDVYGMVTGLIGDLLSYIRLFALGVSSAILGFVFNELAMSLKPDIIIVGPIVMLIILIVGHGMTLFMAGLGAFVHPIRLTFVEFYKNAGFSGGGKRYVPFAEKRV